MVSLRCACTEDRFSVNVEKTDPGLGSVTRQDVQILPLTKFLWCLFVSQLQVQDPLGGVLPGISEELRSFVGFLLPIVKSLGAGLRLCWFHRGAAALCKVCEEGNIDPGLGSGIVRQKSRVRSSN